MAGPALSHRVVVHPDRLQQGELLAFALGAEVMVDSGRGHLATADLAWGLPAGGAGWVVVWEDDAVPVPGIAQQLPAALQVAPSPVVSLYAGSGYPLHAQDAVRRVLGRAEEADACWWQAKAVFWGVAVAIRADLVHDMLAYLRRVKRPYDERLSYWTRTAGHKVSYCIPSLADHLDGPSVTKGRPQRQQPRRAFRTGGREVWTSATIKL